MQVLARLESHTPEEAIRGKLRELTCGPELASRRSDCGKCGVRDAESLSRGTTPSDDELSHFLPFLANTLPSVAKLASDALAIAAFVKD